MRHVSVSNPFSQGTWDHCWKREQKDWKSQSQWIIIVTWCALNLTGQLHILTDNSCDCIQALARQKSRHGRGKCLEAPPEYLLTTDDCWERKRQFSSGRGYSCDSGWACTRAHTGSIRKLAALGLQFSGPAPAYHTWSPQFSREHKERKRKWNKKSNLYL